MDSAGWYDHHQSGENSPHSQQPFRADCWGSSCHTYNRKVPRVCRYFQWGFCFHGHQCRYQHLRAPNTPEWDCHHSESRITLPGPHLGLTQRGLEPTYLPSMAMAVGWAWAGTCWDMEPGLQEVGGHSWKPLSLSSADGHHGHSQESQPEFTPVWELIAPLRSLDLEEQQGKQDSRDVVCGICMDKVWDKPEAERMFGILPNCTHAHCLDCLRTWRKNRQDLPLDVIKACPQCRVHSSYIIPHKFWVGEGAEKEQLIRNFKARTRYWAQHHT